MSWWTIRKFSGRTRLIESILDYRLRYSYSWRNSVVGGFWYWLHDMGLPGCYRKWKAAEHRERKR